MSFSAPFSGGLREELRPGSSFCVAADAPLAVFCVHGSVDAGLGGGGEYRGLLTAGSGAAAIAAGEQARTAGGPERTGQGVGGTQRRSWRGRGEVVLVSDVPRSARSVEGLRRAGRNVASSGRDHARSDVRDGGRRGCERQLLLHAGSWTCDGATTVADRRSGAGVESSGRSEPPLLDHAHGRGSECRRQDDRTERA